MTRVSSATHSSCGCEQSVLTQGSWVIYISQLQAAAASEEGLLLTLVVAQSQSVLHAQWVGVPQEGYIRLLKVNPIPTTNARQPPGFCRGHRAREVSEGCCRASQGSSVLITRRLNKPVLKQERWHRALQNI